MVHRRRNKAKRVSGEWLISKDAFLEECMLLVGEGNKITRIVDSGDYFSVSFESTSLISEMQKSLDDLTRWRIIERDGGRCVLCGDRPVDVHEIIPRSKFGKKTIANAFKAENRVCLCRPHHADAHTKLFREKLLALMSERYGYKYD